MTEKIIHIIKKLIKKNLKNLFLNYNINNFFIIIKTPQILEFGDLSCDIALKISKTTKLETKIISEKIIKNIIINKKIKKYIFYIEKKSPGFINIKYSNKTKKKLINSILNNVNFFKKNYKNKNIIIEYVSANPTGPLHIGHIRQGLIGNIISKIFKIKGYNVHKEYYYNDRGSQIKKLLSSIKLNNKNQQKNQYKGKYINKLINYIKKKEIKKNLKKHIILFFKKSQKRDLKKVGIKFNQYFSERYIEKNFLNFIKIIKKKKLIYKKNKAWWINFKYNDQCKDKVIITKKRKYTYFILDVIYHIYKWKRGFLRAINIHGVDHIGIIKEMTNVMENLNAPKNFLKYILHKLVNIKYKNKNIKLSKRNNNYITLSNLRKKIKNFYKNKKILIKKKKIFKIIKLFLISKKLETEFNINIDLFFLKNNKLITYIEESYKNIKTAIKYRYKNFNSKKHIILKKEINELIITVFKYENIINEIYKNLSPHILLKYLIDIIKKFNNLYNNFLLLNNNKIKIKLYYSALKITKIIFKKLLIILNIN